MAKVALTSIFTTKKLINPAKKPLPGAK